MPLRGGLDHSAGTELLPEVGAFRVVLVLRLFLGIEVVEVAEKFVEPVVRGQEFVLVAEMVLAELASHVPQRLEQLGDGRIFLANAEVGTRQPHFAQPGAEGKLTRDEGRAARRAALLARSRS